MMPDKTNELAVLGTLFCSFKNLMILSVWLLFLMMRYVQAKRVQEIVKWVTMPILPYSLNLSILNYRLKQNYKFIKLIHEVEWLCKNLSIRRGRVNLKFLLYVLDTLKNYLLTHHWQVRPCRLYPRTWTQKQLVYMSVISTHYYHVLPDELYLSRTCLQTGRSQTVEIILDQRLALLHCLDVLIDWSILFWPDFAENTGFGQTYLRFTFHFFERGVQSICHF